MSVAPLLAAAEARRDKHMKQMEDLLAPGVAEGRSSLTDEEKTTFEKLGRKLTDDVVDTSLAVVFGNAIPAITGVPDDGKEIPALTSDNVGPGGKHYTGTFPYLGAPR